MPRYILEIPRTEDEQLASVARDENVPPRTLLHWMVKTDLAARVKRAAECADRKPEPQVA